MEEMTEMTEDEKLVESIESLWVSIQKSLKSSQDKIVNLAKALDEMEKRLASVENYRDINHIRF